MWSWPLLLCCVGLVSAGVLDLCARPRISAGVTHTCVIDNNFNVKCFGESGDNRDNPGFVTAADKFVSIAVGWRHTCAIKNTRYMICFGYEGPLDNRLDVPQPPDWPRQSAGGFLWLMASLGVASSCAVMQEDRERYMDSRPADDWSLKWLEPQPSWLPPNQTLLCWGAAAQGQLKFPVYDDWTMVSSGGFHACGIRTGAELHCWGENSLGQLGPTLPAGPNDVATLIPGSFIQVAAGVGHTCAIQSDLSGVCWGDGRFGQTVVPCDVQWMQLCAGDRHSCGISTSNELRCWGDNESNQITVDSSITDWVEVTCGAEHTCGLRSTGDLLCWGANQFGQATPPAGLQVVACVSGL